MFAKFISLSAPIILLIASLPGWSFAQAANAPQVYIGALDTYTKSGDVTRSAIPLLAWKPKDFETAIAALVASGDAARMRAAAVFHLDVGVALAGFSLGSAKLHLDMGEDLLGKLRETYK